MPSMMQTEALRRRGFAESCSFRVRVRVRVGVRVGVRVRVRVRVGVRRRGFADSGALIGQVFRKRE